MRFALALALALVLVGCGGTLTRSWKQHARSLTLDERAEVQRVVDTWRQHGHPWRARCDEAIATLRIAPLPPEDVLSACYGASTGACLSPGVPRSIILRADLALRDYASAIRHEALHLVAGCAREGDGWSSDPWHQLPNVWELRDRYESIEWYARP